MQHTYCNLSATDGYTGAYIQKFLLSPIVYVVYCLFLLPFLIAGDVVAVLLAAFLLYFYVHVVQEYLDDELFNDMHQTDPQNAADYLSSALVRTCVQKHPLSVRGLIEASTQTSRGAFLLRELGIDAQTFMAHVDDDILAEHDICTFIARADELRKMRDEVSIGGHTIITMLLDTPGCTELLHTQDIASEDIEHILRWEKFHYAWEQKTKTWHPRDLLKYTGSIGRDWVQGYTDELDRLTTDISEDILVSGQRSVVIQQKEIESILHILSRSQQQNVLILGKSGVGKSTLIENVAYTLRQQELKHSQDYTRVLMLKTEVLLSGLAQPDAFLLQALARAKQAGRFVLVIDNFAQLVKSGNDNVFAVLTKFLEAPNISLLAIADTQEYHSLIKRDVSLDTLFEKIHMNDASDDETMQVLMMHYFTLEQRRHMHVTYKALKSVLDLSKRYIGKQGFPGKAIAVLEDAVIAARRRNDRFVTEDDVRAMVSLKSHVDVRKMTEDDRQRLLVLEEELSKKIIGQKRAVTALVSTLKRARMDLGNKGKPLGTFLFLGPTGVGKTQTAKVLADEYFGSSENIIRLDMNEYSNEGSAQLIIGSPNADSDLNEGYLARRVQDRPFSLILLDEIEKAHPKVLNVFLQILDEGELTDAVGVQTDFRNTIIIATSNAGAHFLRDRLQQLPTEDGEVTRKALVDELLQQQAFSPEFLNRFDEVILFHPLSAADAKAVALIMLNDIVGDLYDKRGIKLTIHDDALEALVQKGYSQDFGAREMRRVILEHIENYLADYLLRHEVKRGEEVVIRKDDLSI